jgi:hypothetical protein
LATRLASWAQAGMAAAAIAAQNAVVRSLLISAPVSG